MSVCIVTKSTSCFAAGKVQTVESEGALTAPDELAHSKKNVADLLA